MREQQELAQRELWSSNGLTPEQRVGQEVRRQERLRQEEEEAEQLRKAIAESEALAREYHERQKAGSGPSEVPPSDMDAVTPADAFGYSTLEHSNYDDEDAELQAALRASLENIPEGWEYPETSQSPPSKLPEHQVQASKSAKNVNILQDMDVDGDEEWPSESEVDHDGTASSKGTSAVAREQAAPNVDEIRLARLARFGS
jgi:ataxin-3